MSGVHGVLVGRGRVHDCAVGMTVALRNSAEADQGPLITGEVEATSRTPDTASRWNRSPSRRSAE